MPSAPAAYTCGLAQCSGEAHHLASETTSYGSGCSTSYTTKVSLVASAPVASPTSGTVDGLVLNGSMSACSAATSCCLELDTPSQPNESDFFCELEYAASDSDLVIGNGWQHQEAVHRGATCAPSVDFATIDATYSASWQRPNLAAIDFDEAEAGYLAGVLAAHVSSAAQRRLGVVTGPRTKYIARLVTGFTNGVASVCPTCEFVMMECSYEDGGFASAPCGVRLSRLVTLQGVDVLFGAGGLTGSAAITYAASPPGSLVFGEIKGSLDPVAWVVGQDTDEWVTTFGSGAVPGASRILTSAVKRYDRAARLVIGNHLVGEGSGNQVLNVASSGVGVAGCHDACADAGGPVSEGILSATAAVEASLASGEITARVDASGRCTGGVGRGCPIPEVTLNSVLPTILGAAIGGGGGAVLLLICCICYIVRRERRGAPLFMRIEDFAAPGVELAASRTAASPRAGGEPNSQSLATRVLVPVGTGAGARILRDPATGKARPCASPTCTPRAAAGAVEASAGSASSSMESAHLSLAV